MCRSRQELSNAYLLAKIGVDTAENEPLEVWGKYSILFNRALTANALHSVAPSGAADLQLSAIGLVLQGGDIRSGRRDAL